MSNRFQDIPGTSYIYDSRLQSELTDLHQRVNVFRTIVGTLSENSLEQLREYFRLKNIYNSNAIEGNSLSFGETKMVVQEGLTITGKPLKDTVEAKNLDAAMDFFEDLANNKIKPIEIRDIKNIHRVILGGIDDRNAGAYRSVFVEISGSKYRPPDPARIETMMNELGYWLTKISDPNTSAGVVDPLVVACTAHAWFVYIHPFIDGNGRTARLLMNLLLIRNGYPLTIITKDDRQRYYDALEESQGSDLTPFIRLVLESALESVEVYEQAGRTQLDIQQFAQSLLTEQDIRVKNAYAVFESAMRLLRGYFNQVVQVINEKAQLDGIGTRIGLRDFGILEEDKYAALRNSQSAKKTWFFRITFYNVNDSAKVKRYLFFFGYASSRFAAQLQRNDVTLHIATEVYPFYYERLSDLQYSGEPNIYEISYEPSRERFIILNAQGEIHDLRAEEIAQEFTRQAFSSFL